MTNQPGGSWTLAQALEKAQPRTATVRLSLRGDLAREHERLEQKLAEAQRYDEQHNEPDRAPEIAEQIVAVEAEMRDAEVEFVLTSIGKRAWSDLLAQFPPSDEERKQGLDHDPEKFPSAAIAASLTEPSDVTPEGVDQLADVLTVGQWMRLWTACLNANLGDRTPGESVAASAVLRRSRPSSPTADQDTSPGASS